MFGSGFLKVLVVSFLLLLFTVESSNHNRPRAALMPMMVGMMVRMVAAMMGSTEAHMLLFEFQTSTSYTRLNTFKSIAALGSLLVSFSVFPRIT